jgi:paraquat-inducible protein B
MSTPEEKLVAAANQVGAEITKVKAWYKQYQVWVVAIVALIAGAIVGRYV